MSQSPLRPRPVRLAGRTIGPGEEATVQIPLAGTRGPSGRVPAFVAVGTVPGPRVAIMAGLRGFEETPVLAARSLMERLRPAHLSGSVVVVPVARPGGALRPDGPPTTPWPFPGRVDGNRKERNAFSVFSQVVVGSTALLIITSPRPGQRALLSVQGPLEDTRVAHLARASGAAVIRAPSPPWRSLLAASLEVGVPGLCLELGDESPSEHPASEELALSVLRILELLGMCPSPDKESPVAAPALVIGSERISAPEAGLLEEALPPGATVKRRAVLARIQSLTGGPTVNVLSPGAGVVLESPGRVITRAGQRLFLLGKTSRGSRIPPLWRTLTDGPSRTPTGRAPTGLRPQNRRSTPSRVGWAEWVALPEWGVTRLKAKIDTGARSSALHVGDLKVVGTSEGPPVRPILEFKVQMGRRTQVVRTVAREYVSVRDSSGRAEERPVVETVLVLGNLKRRVRITLTHRGDMLFPMLIGRTALAVGLTVDPNHRYLTRRKAAKKTRAPSGKN